MTISRNGEVINVSLKATKLLMPVVTSRIIEENGKKVGYLTLSVFNDTADIQISNHLAKLENENIEGLSILGGEPMHPNNIVPALLKYWLLH